ALLVEQEREAAGAILGPGAHDDLPARLGPDGHAGGLDEGLQREAREPAEGLRALDDGVGAGVDELGAALVLAVDGRGEPDRLEPGAGGARVAADEANHLRTIAAGSVQGADHETDRLPRRRAE